MRPVASRRYDAPPPEWPAKAQRDADKPAGRADERTAGRSLMVLPNERPHGPAPTRWTRPSAVFLAQLIAIALEAPQTRARRRAEPADAQAAYATATPEGARAGRLCRRTL